MGEIVEILAAVEGQAETHLFIKSLSLAAPDRNVGNKADRHCLPVLSLKCGILTFTPFLLSTNFLCYISNKSLTLIGNIIKICCKFFKILYYLCTIST